MFSQYSGQPSSSKLNQAASANGTRSIIRKTSSNKRIVRRSSSKKDKENGNNQSLQQQTQSNQPTSTQRTFGILSTDNTPLTKDDNKTGSSYKPRL